MTMTKRRSFSDTFKVAVALKALRDDKTIHAIAAKRTQQQRLKSAGAHD